MKAKTVLILGLILAIMTIGAVGASNNTDVTAAVEQENIIESTNTEQVLKSDNEELEIDINDNDDITFADDDLVCGLENHGDEPIEGAFSWL